MFRYIKKIIITLLICGILFFAYITSCSWVTISNGPTVTYGRVLLKDNQGNIITDRAKSGGYVLPYDDKLDIQIVQDIIQIEDIRFYEHNGVDIPGKIASLIQNIKAGTIVRGGSTITEQYVKNIYYNDQPRTLYQKLREAVTAIILEQKLTKEEILRGYLSTVYMGNNQYGIKNLLSKDITDDTILNIITRLRYPNITEKNRNNAELYRERLATRLNKKPTTQIIENNHFKTAINIFPLITTRIEKEIQKYCSNQNNTLSKWTYTIPSDICTTLNQELQLTINSNLTNKSYNIARNTIDTLIRKNVTNASILIIDPSNEKIIVYIGNINSSDEIDMITRPRSVGSLLKPFIYLFALQEGADSEDYLLDEKTAYETEIEGKYFIPENYNPKSYGPIRLREALGNSLNAATVKLSEYIGLTKIYNKLNSLGLKLEHDIGHYGYGISLGTVETSLENMVFLYKNLLSYEDKNIWQIGEILSNSRNRAKTFGINSILGSSIPMSVKTGTSTDFRDNWTISYHKNAIIGVWVGNTDGSSMGDISGISGAGPIWHNIAEEMIKENIIKPYNINIPIGIQQISICLDRNCFQKELAYSKKQKTPQSRPKDGLYYTNDFYGKLNQEEKEKWNIQ